MVEYRAQLIGGTLCLFVLVILSGWWYSRRESSSVASTIRAEAIVQRLRQSKASPETADISVQQGLQRLEELTPQGTSLFTRFSGVVAEEEVLQNVQPLSKDRFDIASKNLEQADLPIDSSITSATFLSRSGNVDEALRLLDQTIEKSGDRFPMAHAYALLQKAELLREQNKTNTAEIDELTRYMSSHPELEASFDHVFSGKAHSAIAFLKRE
jgi:hypothetical protein